MTNTYEAVVGSLTTFSTSTREEYKTWEKEHDEMVKSPPTGGKQYLNHALNLVRLFEGLGELHPVAKAVVVTFKAVVLYEKDRKENNARVQCVLLAQTDMMHVFIELQKLHKYSVTNGEAKIPHVNTQALSDAGRRIERDIKECGNSFDTYYSERKLVKFFKSDEWKQRMNDFVDIFTRHKQHVQTLLAFHTQHGIDDLKAQMGRLLDTLFKATNEEQKLRKKAGDPRLLHKLDDAHLDELLAIAHDTATRQTSSETKAGTAAEKEARKRTIMKEIRNELNTSVEDLCRHNLASFQQKLNFHAEYLKEHITGSARTVIQALQGPHDRLRHADLRELWKEMKWIFCVEHRQFLLALQEYYVDFFFRYSKDSTDAPETSGVAPPAAGAVAQDQGHAQHPDAWTLTCINHDYFDRISSAIDKDRSGFIRISEANDFTDGIPANWSLPQWCAYHVVGWEYEDRIYQFRIRKLIIQMCETQATALASNREDMSVSLNWIADWFLPLSTRKGASDVSDPPSELIRRVQSKVVEQDRVYRKALGGFKEFGLDSSTLALVFRDKDLETYVLILITLLMEQWLNVFQLCSSEILDTQEFDRIMATVDVVTELVDARIKSFQDERKANDDTLLLNALRDFRGGIFYDYQQDLMDESTPLQDPEHDNIANYIQDARLLNGIPLDALRTNEPEFVNHSQGEVNIDHEPPSTWDESEVPAPESPSVTYPLPQTDLFCEDCGRNLISDEPYFTCIECDDTIFCSPCWHSGTTRTEDHLPHHPMVRVALAIPGYLGPWMIALAHHEFENLRDCIYSSLSCDDDHSMTGPNMCMQCEKTPDTAYMCIMHECQDYMLCENCVARSHSEPDDVDSEVSDSQEKPHSHQSWHTMLVVRNFSDLVAHVCEGEDGEGSEGEEGEGSEGGEGEGEGEEKATSPTIDHHRVIPAETTNMDMQKLANRVVALENEIRNANKEMKEMMMQLLAKMASVGATALGHVEKSMEHRSIISKASGFGSTTVTTRPTSRRHLDTEYPTEELHFRQASENEGRGRGYEGRARGYGGRWSHNESGGGSDDEGGEGECQSDHDDY